MSEQSSVPPRGEGSDGGERVRPTPGPWKWHWRFEDGEANGTIFSEVIIGHAYAVAICPRYQKRPQWEADAALIAAAPDLLAALKLVMQWLGNWDVQFADDDEWLEDEQTIRAALKKAEPSHD